MVMVYCIKKSYKISYEIEWDPNLWEKCRDATHSGLENCGNTYNHVSYHLWVLKLQVFSLF